MKRGVLHAGVRQCFGGVLDLLTEATGVEMLNCRLHTPAGLLEAFLRDLLTAWNAASCACSYDKVAQEGSPRAGYPSKLSNLVFLRLREWRHL